MRQEQVVFLGGVALLGFLSFGLFGGDEGSQRTRRGRPSQAVEREQFPAPEIEAVLARSEATPSGARPLFAPPRDTRPLPPLPLIEPPRPELAALLPVTDPGPSAAVYGRLLRRAGTLTSTPGLFEDLGGDGSAVSADDQFFGSREPAAEPDDPDEPVGATIDEFYDESPEERAARIAGYRQRYDWVRRTTGPMLFGRIENEDRFRLLTDTSRASEAILLVEVDPETGVERNRMTGAVALPVARGVVSAFGFAETVANELAIRDLELGPTVTRGSFDERMQFAAWCVARRLEATEALATARRVYRSLAQFDADDPEPRLGLARALEASFDFEGALLEYRRIVEEFPLEAIAHVGLAELEARFLLYEEAEAGLRRAVSVDKGAWEARFALGRFLHARGRHAEAVEHLAVANRAAPTDPGELGARVAIRNALGTALLATGDVDEAARAFSSAASADASDQVALAGRMVCLVLSDPEGGGAAARELASATQVELPGFELLMARGLAAVADGAALTAEREFTDAIAADPLRATQPYAALAYVARETGYPDEAIELAERALEADPRNAYAHYLRGRLLGERDAYEEAREALIAALDVELDFEDALVAMGDMVFRLGRFEDAERYLERAVVIGTAAGATRPEVHGLRGLNLLRLDRVAEARDSFQAARSANFTDPVAMAGLAWCTYLGGDTTEALVELAELDEARRDRPEEDPWRVWARSQQERITNHTAKQEWFDALNRKRLRNTWLTDEKTGPTMRMVDGAVELSGAFQRAGQARVYREEPAGLFVSFEASVWVEPTNVRAGIFIARERPRAGETEVTDEISVSRHKDGTTQVRILRSRQKPEEIDMESSFPTGQWVRLRIEREGESSETRVTVSLDGVPLLEGVRAPAIGSGSSPLLMGVFAEGDVGREALVKMDDVSVVRRLR